jgi:hypothetical protein
VILKKYCVFAPKERQERIIHHCRQLAHHQAHTQGPGAQELPRLAAYISAFADQLSDQLQRDQYGLLDDQEVLHTHHTRLLELRAHWLQAQSRQDAVQSALTRNRKAQTLHCETQAEEEIGEIKSAAHSACTCGRGIGVEGNYQANQLD